MHECQLAGRAVEHFKVVKVLTVLQSTGKPGCALCWWGVDGVEVMGLERRCNEQIKWISIHQGLWDI